MREPPPPVVAPPPDAGVRPANPAPTTPVTASGVVEGVVTLTAPIPAPRPPTIDAATAARRGCREAATNYYAHYFGITTPGALPEAVVTIDAHTTQRPPTRRRFATFRDCSIEPRILAMALGDELFMHAETNAYHLPKVDGLGSTISQLLQRGEDQLKHVLHPGRYIIHSVTFPPWMQTPLVVTPNPFYDQTDREGHYRIEHVPPGTYTMHAWFPNATPVDATITVRAGETTRQNLSLTPFPEAQIRPNQPPTLPDAGPVIP